MKLKLTSNHVGSSLMLWGSLYGSYTGNLGMAVGFMNALLLIQALEIDRKTMAFMRKYIKHLELKQWAK